MNTLQQNILEAFNDLLSLVYPNVCICCDTVLVKQERIICSACNIELPRTYFHLIKDNPIEMIFWGRTKIEKASSYFLYKKGSRYQKLMHYLKYKNMPEIGVELGKRFGAELNEVSYFDEIDALVPVPLHPRKERIRGYNQSLAIAEGLSAIMKKEIFPKVLYRKHFSESQTRKGRFERWENMSDIFAVKDGKEIENKQVLLVDDIVTTGSTLEACANALLQVEGVKVSIVTLAFSSQ